MKWKKIDDYNRYSVSDTGLVRNDKTGRILKTPKAGHGYLVVNLSKNGKRSFTVHRLVAKAFINNPENKPTVNHFDGDKSNNNVSNLEWATYSENNQHALDNGLRKSEDIKGEKHGRAKLTEDQVLEIRAIKGKTYQAIADDYGVSYSAISYIINRKLWKHI